MVGIYHAAMELVPSDKLLLGHLRQNARTKVTHIAKRMGLPATTVYDKLRSHERKYIARHTCLLDFPALGLPVRTMLALRVPKPQRVAFEQFARQHANCNGVYRTNHRYDYLLEMVFPNLLDPHRFTEELGEQFGAEAESFPILETLAEEQFLCGTDDAIA